MAKDSKESWRFTWVLHDVQEELELDLAEYCVCNSVFELSIGPNAPVPGYCTKSKEYIAEFLGYRNKKTGKVESRTVKNIIKRLLIRGVLIKHPDNRKYPGGLKVYDKWYEATRFYKRDPAKELRDQQAGSSEKVSLPPDNSVLGQGKSFTVAGEKVSLPEGNKFTGEGENSSPLYITKDKAKNTSERDKGVNTLTFEKFISVWKDDAEYKDWKIYKLSYYFDAVLAFYKDESFNTGSMKAKIKFFINRDIEHEKYNPVMEPVAKRDLSREAFEIVESKLDHIKNNLSDKENYEIVYELLKDDTDFIHKEAIFEGKIEAALRYYKERGWK